MKQTHELKTERPWFAEVYYSEKTAELRRHDRSYCVGDDLLLREYLPGAGSFTSSSVRAEITHIVTDSDGPWLAEGMCMLSFRILERTP